MAPSTGLDPLGVVVKVVEAVSMHLLIKDHSGGLNTIEDHPPLQNATCVCSTPCVLLPGQ